ncbi:aldo/keto reductase [Microbacterium sp. MEC084]|uniref:aldo/keto reductase n=1 Tax=Microbacterium sp. MEC084 TaxID=1963027 RepID=UPI00106F4CBB|nr:aldo/keto reductase [Microbacterium sp. MEC084]MCD1269031.1 aldo/keto reductase [Microbacterium sp. MEC084]
MEYGTLGSSGASVSAFALGTMTFGREATEDESHRMIDRYVAAGGNLIDTADMYGDGESERIVGRWLARADAATRENLVVATKARFPTGPGPNQLGLARKHLAAALEGSLSRLGVETIDLYQLHSWDPHTSIEETLEFLTEARAAGRIHYVGLSNVTAWQLQRYVDVAEFLRLIRPVTIQPQYNLLAREVEWEVVPAALANGLGLLPWSPLAGGWLTGKYTRDTVPADARHGAAPGAMNGLERRRSEERTWAVLDALGEIAAARGVPQGRVALAWLAGRPGVSSVILGARTLAHLDDNLAAVGLVLEDEERAALDAASEPGVADYPYGELGQEQRTRRLHGGRW